MTTRHWVSVKPETIIVDGHKLPTMAHGGDLLSEAYRQYINDYPKFFKMDDLCRLGFVASELLLQAASDRHADSEDRAVILFNRSGSMADDRRYQDTISQANDFFPSPSLFVYTLPNIVTGEIAIRNRYHGETAFYVLSQRDEKLMHSVVTATMLDGITTSAICGWIDCESHDLFDAHIELVDSVGEKE